MYTLVQIPVADRDRTDRDTRKFLVRRTEHPPMSEDASAGIEPLFGPPSAWCPLLADLLAYVETETPTESKLVEWLSEHTDDDRDAIVRRLHWLENVGLLARTDGTYRLDTAGDEYLETRSEAALCSALESTVVGFQTVLDALGIRPVTDVEVADLVARERDIEQSGAELADPYLSWLEAMGYLVREDSINELTAAGRERSNGRAGLTANTETKAGSEPTEAEQSSDPEPDQSPVEALKYRYEHTCMLCGDRRRKSPEEGFAEVRYLLPPGDPHDGPETPANALVVCPNHRADLEHGLVRIDPQSLTVTHAYEPEISGRTLSVADDHDLGPQYLAYHNDVIAAEFE